MQKIRDTARPRTRNRARLVGRTLALLCLVGTAGCSVFMDQAPLGPRSKIAVGHEGSPFKTAWLVSDGEIRRIEFVRGGAE